MLKINFKKIILNSIIILIIFLIDRISKIYILKIAELGNTVDIYVTQYLNLYLIWNKGIAFGLFSFNESIIYNVITIIIVVITIVVLIMVIKNENFKRYPLMLIFGGAIGNLFDRIYYSAVPDFIDFHVNEYHWFVFNAADIIFDEMFIKSKK